MFYSQYSRRYTYDKIKLVPNISYLEQHNILAFTEDSKESEIDFFSEHLPRRLIEIHAKNFPVGQKTHSSQNLFTKQITLFFCFQMKFKTSIKIVLKKYIRS